MDQRLLQQLISNAQKSKKLYDQKVAELSSKQFISTVGNNLITLVANGNYEVLSCTISDEVMDDKETLQDLVASATQNLFDQIHQAYKELEATLMPKTPF